MIITKINIPESLKNSVKRYYLFEKLDKGLNGKLTLVSAPAGFGKSTLISDWVHQNKIPTAWFSIDGNDNDPVDFLNYIIAAIQKLDNKFGQKALELLNSPSPIEPNSIISLLINDIHDIKDKFLLIFDDFHLIENKAIFDLIGYLLDYAPENIHVVLSTRSDPGIPMARLRSQNQLNEIRTKDLSFTNDDISVLFCKKFKLELNQEDVSNIEEKTEGWIAGIQLTALSAQGQDNISDFIQKLKGNNRYIMDYLMEEVLRIQTDDIKDFLLKTSLLKQFSASLCNSVLGRNDSQDIIEDLERNNMFMIPLDSERKWFRFHHLFSHLLKQRLLQNEDSMVFNIHEKAIDWFEKHEYYEIALEHSIEIKNYDKSVQLLEITAEKMWKNGQHDVLLKYGELIPEESIKKSPNFCLFYAWILLITGRNEDAKPLLQISERTVKIILKEKNASHYTNEKYNKLLSKISVAFAYLYSNIENNSDNFSYCDYAIKNLPKDDHFWYSWAWFSYGLAYLSNVEFQKSIDAFYIAYDYAKKSGDISLMSTIVVRLAESEQQLGHYKSAYQKCTELLQLLESKGYSQISKEDWTYAAIYHVMGISQFMWGNLEEAITYYQIAYDLRNKVNDVFLKYYIIFVYSYLLLELGKNIEDVENEILEIQNQPIAFQYLKPQFIGWRIYVFLKRDQVDNADNFAKQHQLSASAAIKYENVFTYMFYLHLLIRQNNFEEAEKLINKIYSVVDNSNMIERSIDIDVLYSVIFKMTGRREIAMKKLKEAMEKASEDNMISSFLANQPYIEDLMEEIVKSYTKISPNISKEFIEHLKSAINQRNNSNSIKKHDLSSRELETLILIGEDLTNQEIANKLYISITTVKTHVRNILSKLNAKNRREAITLAKQKELI